MNPTGWSALAGGLASLVYAVYLFFKRGPESTKLIVEAAGEVVISSTKVLKDLRDQLDDQSVRIDKLEARLLAVTTERDDLREQVRLLKRQVAVLERHDREKG